MKIGIMTMQRIDNYGSFLQALGLKRLIEELGFEVVFVDFKAGQVLSDKKWKNWPCFRLIKAIIKPIDLKKTCLETPYFRAAYPILGLSDNRQYRTKVDVLVVGSDEVFNFIQKNPLVGYAPELIGAHNRAKKVISYAASCGNLSVEKIKHYGSGKIAAKLWNRFSSISVRDESTKKVVEEFIGRSPVQHLDPVLVADFGTLFSDKVRITDYILVYGYPNRFTVDEGEKIKEFARKRGKKLISFCGEQSFCEEYLACSPMEISAYFKHADCIITDTFHGTIFSIINYKPFITLSRGDRQVGYGNENKILDLLERLHLMDRLLQPEDDIEQKMIAPINYEQIDIIRKKERERTIDYLRTNIRL